MRKILLILIAFALPRAAFPEALIPDVVALDGQEWKLCAHPLSLRPDAGVLETTMFGAKGPNWSTACASGYVAHWEVADGRLYLTRLTPCYLWDTTTFDLKKLFGDEYQNGRVEATWVSSTFSAVSGRCLYPVQSGFLSVYEQEATLDFDGGQLVDRKDFFNFVHRSAYQDNPDSLRSYVYRHLKWARVPAVPAGATLEVELSVRSGEKPSPDEVKVVSCRSYATEQKFSAVRAAQKLRSRRLEKEVLRVVRRLPDWSVIVRKGKAQQEYSTRYIYFTQELREKYAAKKK